MSVLMKVSWESDARTWAADSDAFVFFLYFSFVRFCFFLFFLHFLFSLFFPFSVVVFPFSVSVHVLEGENEVGGTCLTNAVGEHVYVDVECLVAREKKFQKNRTKYIKWV